MSNLRAHAERELQLAGLLDPDGDNYGDLLGKAVLELIDVLANQGHSGMSANMTTDVFNRVARREPLTPLTGEDDEWVELAHIQAGVFQNKRCSRVFKQSDRFNGQAYDTEGVVFREPGGACMTNGDSHTPITFPYIPRRVYVDVPVSEPTVYDIIEKSASDPDSVVGMITLEEHASTDAESDGL
jgi:hypothetical protein